MADDHETAPRVVSNIDSLLQFIDLYDEIEDLNIIAYQPNAIVMKHALTVDEQRELFETVNANKSSKTQKAMKHTNNLFRYGHFMRLNIAETKRHIATYPIYSKLLSKIETILKRYNEVTFFNRSQQEIHKLKQQFILNYDMLNFCVDNIAQKYMNSLYYKAPNGAISKHCDKKKEIIILYSLGCTANFYVKGKGMSQGTVFEFQSGDCLIFDATKNADIVHGIDSIQPNTCPTHLQQYPFLIDTRICVQTRCLLGK